VTQKFATIDVDAFEDREKYLSGKIFVWKNIFLVYHR
jgi:hypothetical protein